MAEQDNEALREQVREAQRQMIELERRMQETHAQIIADEEDLRLKRLDYERLQADLATAKAQARVAMKMVNQTPTKEVAADDDEEEVEPWDGEEED